MAKARFYRHANTIDDLKGKGKMRGKIRPYVLLNTVETDQEIFDQISQNLTQYHQVIKKLIEYMSLGEYDFRCCIYLKAKQAQDGILIGGMGYGCATEAAYVTDQDIPEGSKWLMPRLEAIAAEEFNVKSLDMSWHPEDNARECYVWNMRSALVRAYALGQADTLGEQWDNANTAVWPGYGKKPGFGGKGVD